MEDGENLKLPVYDQTLQNETGQSVAADDVGTSDSASQQCGSITHRSSTSGHSKSSNRSNASSVILKKAELEEKGKQLKLLQQLERQRLAIKVKREQEELYLQQQIEAAKLQQELNINAAQVKVLDVESPCMPVLSPISLVDCFPESPAINIEPLHLPVSNKLTPAKADLNDNAFHLEELVHSLRKPQVEVKKFGGDVINFKRFIRQLESVVLVHCTTFEDKLNCLEAYTYGQPNKIVTSYSYMDAEKGFNVALKELNERYGKPDVIAAAFRKKVLDWPEIKPNDSVALDEFAVCLTDCLHAMSALNLTSMNDQENIQKMITKIPGNLHDKWRSFIDRIQRPVAFLDLVTFVKLEAKKINDPIFGKEALSAAKQPPVKPIGAPAAPKKSFAANISRQEITEPLKCQYCEGEHFIGDCKKLKSMSIDKIMEFVSNQLLCYGCLQFGHRRSRCWNILRCLKCGFRHPTILHSDYNLNATNNSTDTNKCEMCARRNLTEAGDFCTLPIIPVVVRFKSRTVNTYAFHDCGSSECFCTKSLMGKLGLTGRNRDITLHTMTSSQSVHAQEVTNIEVLSMDNSDNKVTLPTCFGIDNIPVHNNHIPRKSDIVGYPHLCDIDIPELDEEIGLLIGNNIPDAFTPLEIRTGEPGSPYASKTVLGWIVYNVVRHDTIDASRHSGQTFLNNVSVELHDINHLDNLVRNALNFDFPERLKDERIENSVNDNLFLEKVQKSTVLKTNDSGKYYEVGLPFKVDSMLPNNFNSASLRLKSLESKFKNNDNFKTDYVQFINSMLESGYAEEVEPSSNANRVWYIPHHGIYHKKKNKLRVVFDCSAKCQGVSINDQLLQGPDLANTLIGVLCRFRIGTIAMMADIQSMFHRINVPEEDRDMLRFLWWPNGDTSLKPKSYRMSSHTFGAVSSPSIANFILRKTALDNLSDFDDRVIETVLNNFYVDDCLRSIDGSTEASKLANDLIELLKMGGFRLHKFISNNETVLNSIPSSECADSAASVTLGDSDVMIERALGVSWEVLSDTLTFKINVAEKPKTRRGILSIVSSVFDPLGLAAPALLPAKLLLRDICSQGYSWDQQLDTPILQRWNAWIEDLPLLELVHVNRCVKSGLGKIVSTQLHHFCDSSEIGYGVASYLRMVDSEGHINCNLIMGKARVAPLKRITIPRMELTAATLAVKLNTKIVSELMMPIDEVFYWTDSSTVLCYISNDSARFQTFVANRVAVIRDASDVSQWNFLKGNLNPADDASRGLSIRTFVKQRRWFDGPEHLCSPQSSWPKFSFTKSTLENDPNVKKSFSLTMLGTVQREHPFEKVLNYYSDYDKLIRCIALLVLVTRMLYDKCFTDKVTANRELKITASDISVSELALVKYEQSKYWNDLMKPNCDYKKSDLSKLDPVLIDGVLRVGGRLDRTELSLDAKHQILIPKKSRLAELLIYKVHARVGHLGKNSILSELRRTFWIVGAPTIIKNILSKCVNCKKYNAKRLTQKMADLPANRIEPFNPPFYHSAMDFFGPFELKRARSMVKRYGVIFTCLNSRAVHLEVAFSLDTDSCINAVRRFVARRGKPYSMLSDNGTNIVSAAKELSKSLQEVNKSKLGEHFANEGIKWMTNPPLASHFGGIYERIIRQVRKVLHSLQADQVNRLDDESFQTLLCEVEAILNNRPITRYSSGPNDLDALTPNHLLQCGSRSIDYSVTDPDRTDMYVKRRWRQVQYLSDIFWKRWLGEYVPILQERQKWLKPKTNVNVGDVVLVVDSGMRNSWLLARVTEVKLDKKGFVRVVTVKTKTSTLVRPIHKLCLILEADIK